MGKGDVTAASIVELKAELLKKSQEFRSQKGAAESKPKSTTVWLKKKQKTSRKDPLEALPPKNNKRSQSEYEDEAWERSRAIMEEKAKIYEKLQSGMDEQVSESIRENLLVDFDRKFHEDRIAGRIKDFNEPEIVEAVEMVEIVDEFGRTRRIPKEEYLKQKQEEAADMISSLRNQSNSPEVEGEGTSHYDDSKEVRTKGVGYYRLSQVEGERSRQLAELGVLRQETVEARTRAMILKEQRRIAKDARLQKVQERRGNNNKSDL